MLLTLFELFKGFSFGFDSPELHEHKFSLEGVDFYHALH